jgi:hypothetical protein
MVNTRKGFIMEKTKYELPRDQRSVPLPVMQPIENRSIVFGSSSTEISGFPIDDVNVIRLVASDNCHIEFGDAPVATTTSMFLPAGVIEYFYISGVQKLAVIQNSSSGTLFISIMG